MSVIDIVIIIGCFGFGIFAIVDKIINRNKRKSFCGCTCKNCLNNVICKRKNSLEK